MQLYDWVKYNPYHTLLSGRTPDVSSTTNYTFNVTGLDSKANSLEANFTIIVSPNHAPSPASASVTVYCTKGEFCTYTLLNNSFVDSDKDFLTYSDVTNYTVEGLTFSTLNYTYFGFPHERYQNFTVIVAATDPYYA